MLVVDQLKRFFGKEAIYENDVIVLQTGTTTAELMSLTLPLVEFSPTLKVVGSLVSATGATRTLHIKVDTLNTTLPSDTLLVSVYSSLDGSSYTLEATYNFSDLPIDHTTSGNFVIVSIETSDGKILWTTKDAELGLRPIDARVIFSNLEFIDPTTGDGSLVASYPVFFEESVPRYVINTDYRTLNSVTNSSNTIDSNNDIAIIYVSDGVEMRVGALALYNNQPYENYFPKSSPHFIVTSKDSMRLSLPALVDATILAGNLANIGSYFGELDYQAALQVLNSLDTDPTTGLFYRSYLLASPSSPTYVVDDSIVDIAWNVYLALRFLSSGLEELVNFVVTPNNGTTFLEKLGNLVNTTDGVLIPDTTTQNDYMAFTESMFFLLEKLVESEYPQYAPASFDSDTTLLTLESYVDVINGIVYSSASERDGNSTAPTARTIDLASLMYVFKNAPTTATQDYSQHLTTIKARLDGFIYTEAGGIPYNLDPNDPNYNPLWENLLPVKGFVWSEGETIIDSAASYFVLSLLLPEYKDDVDISPMVFDEGVLRVTKADVTTGRYIVPHLWATSLKNLRSFSGNFIKTSSYTVKVLDDQPVSVSVVQVPTDVGVNLFITLDIPSGIVARAIGVTTQTTYSSAVVLTQLYEHTVTLKIPNVSEDVYIDVFPLRPTL